MHIKCFFSLISLCFVFLPLSSTRSTSCGCSTSRWGTWSTPTAPTLPTSRANWACQCSCVTQPRTRSAKSLLLHLQWKGFQSPQSLLLLLLHPSPRLTSSSCATGRILSASPTSSTCPQAPCPSSVTPATTHTAPPRKPLQNRHLLLLLPLHPKSPPRLHQCSSRSLPQLPSASSKAWSTTATPTGTLTASSTTHPGPWRGRSCSLRRRQPFLWRRKRKRSRWRSQLPPLPSRRKYHTTLTLTTTQCPTTPGTTCTTRPASSTRSLLRQLTSLQRTVSKNNLKVFPTLNQTDFDWKHQFHILRDFKGHLLCFFV